MTRMIRCMPFQDDRYLICSLPKPRLTLQQRLLVCQRHWGIETAHQKMTIPGSKVVRARR